MRNAWPALVLSLAPAVVTLAGGCGGTTAAPTAPGDANSPLAQLEASPAPELYSAGRWTIHLDTKTMTATVEPVEARRPAVSGDLFTLPVDPFFPGGAFHLGGLTVCDETDVDCGEIIPGDLGLKLSYTVDHPFSAPLDPDGTPNGSTNRADLGVTGMMMFHLPMPATLVDDDTQPNHVGDYQYPDSVGTPVSLNGKLFVNADGFWDAKGTSTVCNPCLDEKLRGYRVLVDESLDPRTSTQTGVAISNGGDATGNYTPTTGWSLANIGSSGQDGVSWTGYGMLHQGQSSSNHLVLSSSALSIVGGTLDIEAELICDYTDPRQGANGPELRSNRLPSTSPTDFAYRMPYGALDIASIHQVGPMPVIGSAPNDTAVVTVAVVDEDSSSAVDPNFPLLATPVDLTSIPHDSSISSMTIYGHDFGMAPAACVPIGGTGNWLDPLLFECTVTNVVGNTGGLDLANHCFVTVEDADADPAFVALNFDTNGALTVVPPSDAPAKHTKTGHVTLLK